MSHRAIPVFTLLWLALTQLHSFSAPSAGPLTFDALHKLVSVRSGQTNAVVSFTVTNLSREPAVIRDVSLSCGCSTASLPARPWTLRSGEHGQMTVTTDVRGKRGSLLKTAIVFASSGPQSLTYQVDIQEPSTAEERARNQALAKVDRQAVFRGDCARCHAEPARGKTGQELFSAACGVCHEAEHRAAMVPDLRALRRPVPREHWLLWAAHGKPDTLMPAFSTRSGGPLTDEQILSLEIGRAHV